MNIDHSKPTTADLFRKAIKERDGQAFTRMVDGRPSNQPCEPEDNLPIVLYGLAKEDPTRETIGFIHGHYWTQDCLHEFAVRDIYSYLTKDDFTPTILDCYKAHGQHIQNAFDDTWIDTDALIPERLQSFFEHFVAILDDDAPAKLLDRVKDYYRLDKLEVPLLEWALTYHEATLTSHGSTAYFNLLGYIHEQDRQKAFEILSRSKTKFKEKQYRKADKQLIEWLKLRDLNKKLSDKYQEKHKSAIAKI